VGAAKDYGNDIFRTKWSSHLGRNPEYQPREKHKDQNHCNTFL